MKQSELDAINEKIADRSNVFYWQTDRSITPQQAGEIWADRHKYFTDEELKQKVNLLLEDKIETIIPLDLKAQTNLGNVNSVRIAHLTSGKSVAIRLHPKGIKNGYFHVESAAAQRSKENGIPSYSTLAIHNFEGGDDFAYHVIEKLEGTAMSKWLETHKEDEENLLIQTGRTLKKIHKIEVQGFGPFDNVKAQSNNLVGLHSTYAEAIRAGLKFNLTVLEERSIFNHHQCQEIDKLFSPDNDLLNVTTPVLIHNDFADWNLLTDGKKITGVLDWDECVGGDYVSDLACWSTFFPPSRAEHFLAGYFENGTKPSDFEEKFELLRFRYVISKMTLRIRRYEWEPSETIKEKIEVGKTHLAQSMAYFKI